MINKTQLIDEIRSRLEQEFEAITLAANAAHEAATHEESRAEDQHDTRGLESSYLAGAQAQRAAEIQQQIHLYKHLDVKSFSEKDPIASSAVVELESGGKKSLYFIGPLGGGMKLQFGNQLIQVITPRSPLGEELMGRKKGDSVEIEAQGGLREFEITTVY
jgi:transcription elongation GreA/GreB family factor